MVKLKYLAIAVVFLLMVFQTIYIWEATNDLLKRGSINAKATSGSVGMCINYPPMLSIDCPVVLNQSSILVNNTLFCQLNYTTDPSESVTFSYTPIVQNGILFTIDTSGMMRIWGNQSGIGIYSSNITVRDNATCPLNYSEVYNFEIFDINEPPYLVRNIRSISFTAGSSLSFLFLTDYFKDHENDPLNFSVSSYSPLNIYINPVTSEVKVGSASDVCEEVSIYFTATDSGNLSAISNMITLESVCIVETKATSGGGGSSDRCEPEWKCEDWGVCTANGTRSRDCVDMSGCDLDNLKKTFFEICAFEPSCYDGIKNQGEEGVDCGGVCPPCVVEPTCSDGIKNQGEEAVDCGGPCIACELKQTCFDGIKNQGELGIDCGGPCAVCKEIQVPGIVEPDSNSFLTILLVSFLVIAGLFLLYLIFRKEIKSIIAKLNWMLIKRRLKQVLLSDRSKDDLLKRIREFENKLALLKSQDVFKSESEIIQAVVGLNRSYLMEAFGLPTEFSQADFQAKSEKILLHDSLKKVFASFMVKQTMLETKRILVSRLHLRILLEELKTLIRGTSNYYQTDYYSVPKEEPVGGMPLAKTVALIHNSFVALEFGEVEVAKKRYLDILGLYEQLDEKQKLLVYEDIFRIYNHVKYVLAWS